MPDLIRFNEACRTVYSGGRLIKGIGTKSEKSVHAVLKNYYEPYHDSQEQKIGGYIADIVGENGIIEIQTGHFSSLIDKLGAFLPISRVTVVFPVFAKKRIVTLDGDTGEIKSRRTSPIKENAYDLFRNLFPISQYLTDDNLSFIIVLLEADELRIPPESVGRKKRRRGRLSVIDRVPTGLIDEIHIDRPHDWEKLIPCLFEEDFTTEILSERAGISRETSSMALSALFRGGVVTRTGKKGNAYTYRFSYQKKVDSAL